MEKDWLKFFELLERLQTVSPGLVELALRLRKNQEVLEQVAREPFFERPNRVNLHRCEEVLGSLCKQEDELRQMHEKTAQALLQIQAARRAFEQTLKDMLRAEHRSFAENGCANLHATEEEVVAGLQELKEHSGLELHQFIGELEQVLDGRERTGT